MTAQPEKVTKPINWTPVIIGGTMIGGAALIIWLLTRGEAEDRELAREILEDWQMEFDELKTYTEQIYYGGRQPTEQEVAIISQMLEQMSIKEITIKQLSETVWQEAEDVIKAAISGWWLVPVIIFTPIAGYAAYKAVKGWKDKNQPPPSFPCPKCGASYSTAGALKHHVETEHTPIKQFATEAQAQFVQTSTWVQGAIAVDSALYSRTYSQWSRLGLPEISDLTWGLTSAWVYTIGAASEAVLLKTMLMMLLI